MSKKQNENNKQDKTEESLKETIARLKANRKQDSALTDMHIIPPLNANKESRMAGKRVSKNAKPIETLDRKNSINRIIKKLLIGELTQGGALKELRINVLGIKQDAYANLVNISRKTLSDIENDRGNYKTGILNKAFKPFGLKVGLIPISPYMLISALNA